MNRLRDLFRRLRHLFHRRQADEDLAEEMRLHLELRAARGEAEGQTPAEAVAAARKHFGNATWLREEGRDVWGWGWLESLMQDVRYGTRALATHKAFTITALLSLALGVGANTAVFSVVNAVMLRTLPVKDPHRLVYLKIDGNDNLTNPLWEAIRREQNICSGMLAYAPTRFDLADQGEQQPVKGLWVSGEYFDVLGVPAVLGRLITPEDDKPGGGQHGPVAVISHAFWQTRFGGDTNVIGRTINLDRVVFQIVGVTAPRFTGLEVDSPFSVAIPIGCDPLLRRDRSWLNERSTWWLYIVGRLQENMSREQASARLATVTPAIMQATLPNWDAAGQKDYLVQKFSLESAAHGFSGMGRERRVGLLATMTVVGLVLIIACANIANLLLARATARQQEISVRMAIGASRGRVIRQLLTESVLLSLLGLPGGLLLARWGARWLVGLVSSPRQMFQLDLSLDSRVLLFTTGAALLTGLLFGLAPALRATGISTNEVLKRGARGAIAGGSRFHIGKALVAGQVALSLALLVAAGLFIGTLRNLLNVSLGFDQGNLITARVDTLSRVPKEQRLTVFDEVLTRVRQTPGVASAGCVAIIPLSGQGWNGNLLPEGKVAERGDRTHMTWFNRVSPGYFATMKTPVIRGRDFDARDGIAAPPVMIIGERTARECFGDADPIGKFVARGTNEKLEVIGVVRDTKYRSLQEANPRTAFVPQAQEPEPGGSTTIMIRGGIPPSALLPGLRAAITNTQPGLSLEFGVMDLRIRENLRPQRLIAVLTGFFGALALFLAIVGLYGVTSYAVAQRQGEIGIRMALGARRSNILWLVLRDVALILGLGALAGMLISLGAGRYLGSIVYGLNPAAPTILGGASVVLAVAGLLAGLAPALRASKLDPSVALRQE